MDAPEQVYKRPTKFKKNCPCQPDTPKILQIALHEYPNCFHGLQLMFTHWCNPDGNMNTFYDIDSFFEITPFLQTFLALWAGIPERLLFAFLPRGSSVFASPRRLTHTGGEVPYFGIKRSTPSGWVIILWQSP